MVVSTDVITGNVHITRSSNNFKIQVFDQEGNPIARKSALPIAKGRRRGARRAVQTTTEIVADEVVKQGVTQVSILDRGRKPGGSMVAETFEAKGVQVRNVLAASSFGSTSAPFGPNGKLYGRADAYFPRPSAGGKVDRCYCCNPVNEPPHFVWDTQAERQAGKPYCTIHSIQLTPTKKCTNPTEDCKEPINDREE